LTLPDAMNEGYIKRDINASSLILSVSHLGKNV